MTKMHKNILLLAMCAAMPSVAAAMTPSLPSNVYVQGDVGYSHLTAKEDAQDLKGDEVFGRVAVGRTHGQARYAVDYTHFGTAERHEHGTRTLAAGEVPLVAAGTYPVVHSTELDAQSVGVSGYYDFKGVGKLTPYVGARVGVSRLSRETTEELQHGFFDHDLSEHTQNKTTFGVGAGAGVSYQVLPALPVDAGAEYNYLGKLENATVSQYGAKVGVRYQF
ncbi:MAG: opacity family porin [Moraxella sp.]|nr:opacity family porin [Moraxella sp.]